MSDIKQIVGDLIRETRKAKGLTQKELGNLLGLGESGESRVNRYESGKQNPTVETLQKIAEVLDVNVQITFQ